ncbi:enoyl-CoA delta isomerase 1, mitochondrial isoform X2 [Hydra vulgaris]|uniref:enoyl-CoA delta isomerase 1, mitochondrial isoform X2 n=1 Tax=Hydra vulgaris TaxID=6087 RepID=UPI001F5F980D|nr:enoyl-CoA delta isomerase 1, mitochondrial-like [Hydra vulgaris]
MCSLYCSSVNKKPIMNFLKESVKYSRRFISTYKFLDIKETNQGYKIIQLEKKPVNSLNTEFCSEIIFALNESESDKKCRAINGACPAGGCMIAFSSDYRVMVDGKHTIGLNETLLGLSAPFWLAESLKLLVGHREAERMLSLGILSTPSEALKIGIVDQVVPPEHLLTCCITEMEKWLKVPDVGRIQTKKNIRKQYIEQFISCRNQDLDLFVKGVQQENVQNLLGSYIEALKKKK